MILYPTHTCFDDAMEYLFSSITDHRVEHLTLVHGICMVPNADVRFAHAWVEQREGANVFVTEAALTERGGGEKVWLRYTEHEFVEHYRPVKCYRYSVAEVIILGCLSNASTGPWEAEIEALCGPDRKVWDANGVPQ